MEKRVYVIKIGDMYVKGDHKKYFSLSFTDKIEEAKHYYDEVQVKVVNRGKYNREYIPRDESTLEKATEVARLLHGKVEEIKQITTISEVVFDAKN